MTSLDDALKRYASGSHLVLRDEVVDALLDARHSVYSDEQIIDAGIALGWDDEDIALLLCVLNDPNKDPK